MLRAFAIAVVLAVAFDGPAYADGEHQASVSHVSVTGDGVTLCRHAFAFVDGGHTVDEPTADCWHVDLATGNVAAVPIVAAKDQHWPDDDAKADAVLVPDGVKVCAATNPSDCKTIPLKDASTYELVAINAARTVVAVQKSPPDDKQINIRTFDVATGHPLAKLTASGDILQVLGDTLFVQASCAAPCGGTLYSARTGKRIAVVSDDVASANDANNVHLRGDVWVFKEIAREQGEPGILLEDVATGNHVKRIALSKLVRVDGADVTAFQVLPARGGILVIDSQTTRPAFAGDIALVDMHGKVVKRIAAPPWPRPLP